MSALPAIVDFVLAALTLLVALPAFVVLFEVLSARRAVGGARGNGQVVASAAMSTSSTAASRSARATPRAERVAILMPAHNEEGGIAASLACALAQLRTGDRLLVVADNCNDRTAAIAREAGAQVIERHDDTLRGKGYALDFGVRHLRQDPPDVVLILDADCQLQPGAVDLLVDRCARLNRPAQARYLMSFPGGAGDFGSRIAQFAFIVKNRVRPMGMARLGLPCQLLGTGMAFPWDAISRAPLATGHIVEDMKLGVDLTAMGYPAMFVDEARVDSAFPISQDGVATQRKRWEHGHLQVLFSAVPGLLADALRRRRLASLALALDLAVPPLALLAMTQALALALTIALWLLGGRIVPLAIASAGFAALMLAVILAWRAFGREAISLATLAKAPLYALRKVPVYLGFVSARQTAWVRSRRDNE